MKKVRILALHLAYGGVEKAIISIANLLSQRYAVEILSVYHMPNSPAFPLDEGVRVRYLLRDVPNREEWKQALREKRPLRLLRESFRGLRILLAKRLAVRRVIRGVHDGVLITTRHEDNLVLSRLGDPAVLKIAQLHHDHRFEPRYVRDFRHRYGGIDVFALLTPGLVEEVRQMLPPDSRTKLVCIPNFLEHYPESPSPAGREKILLSVGRLDPIKGFDRLIRCFAAVHRRLPEWKLHIVGEGTERERLEALLGELGLRGAVELTGRLEAGQVEAEMLSAAVFAMSSHSEGFPFVLVEAQSCALPTVAFDVRVGPAAILADGEDGFLVPDGDLAAYEAALLRLMEDDALRQSMASRALERSHRFSREKISEIWFSVIGEKA